MQPGASTIYREEGHRLIAIKFGVHGRDLGSTVAAAQQATSRLIRPPYRVEWSGEFEQMERAEKRLMIIVPLSMVLVVVMLYLAFVSLRDVLIVLANVTTLVCGGILALLLVGINFSVSAAVGFISIFGVAIMNGLVLVSSIHRLRLQGKSLEDAVLEGAVDRAAAHVHDDLDRHPGPASGGRLDADRRAKPTAAGRRGHRRHADVPGPEPTPDARAVLHLPQAAPIARVGPLCRIVAVPHSDTYLTLGTTIAYKRIRQEEADGTWRRVRPDRLLPLSSWPACT